jgi:hypothetical protein
VSDIFEIILCCVAFPVFYFAGKMGLLEQISQMFILWADDIVFKNKTKNGLSPETKQAILDDFMKNSKQ